MAEGAIAEAFVRIRPETSGFRGALTSSLQRDLKQTENDTARFTKGVAAGSGALQSLGRAAVFASSSVLGGYGLAFALKTVTKSATDSLAIQVQLRNAVERSGLSYSEHADQIEKVIRAQEALGFSEDVATRAFTLALRTTGSVVGANRLLASSANVARATNKDLYNSTLLLVRGYGGATAGLKRLGVEVEKGSKGFKVIDQVQRKFAGSAEAYANSAAGAQARLSVAIQNTETTIGLALLPTITRLATQLSDWLDKSKNQERIQRDVNEAVRVGTGIVEGLGTAFHIVAGPIKAASDALGGFEQTAKDLTLLFAGWKVAGIIGSFGRIGAAAGEAGAAGKVAKLEGGLGRLKAFTGIVLPITIALGITESKQYKETFGSLQKKLGGPGPGKFGSFGFLFDNAFQLPGLVEQSFKNVYSYIAGGSAGTLTFADVFPALQAGLLSVSAVQTLKPRFKTSGDYKAALAYAQQYARAAALDQAAARHSLHGVRPGETGTVVGKSGPGATRAQQAQAALSAAAATTKTTADDLKALTAQHQFLQDQIAVETRRLGTALTQKQYDKFFANLQALRDQDNAALGQIQSIEDQNAAAAKQKADAARRAAEKAARERAAAAKKIVEARNKEATADAQVALAGVPKLGVDVSKLRSAYEKAQAAKAKAAATAVSIREGTLTLARQAADLAVARAGSNQVLLDKATALEKKADEALIKFYKGRIAATKGLARQNYQQQLIAAQIDLAGLGKKNAASGFTLAQLYAEAESEYKLYGSNYGPVGAPLSPQGDRGGLSGLILKRKGDIHVTQVFMSPARPSQAMNDARAGARYLN